MFARQVEHLREKAHVEVARIIAELSSHGPGVLVLPRLAMAALRRGGELAGGGALWC